MSEKLLSENQPETYDEKDLEELDEEADLAKAKESGHRRIDPSVPSESVSKEKQMFKCSWKDCKMQLESKGLLKSHMNEHEPIFHCDVCGVDFTDVSVLKEHIGLKHDGIRWQCDVCDKEFSSEADLNTHMTAKHIEKEWNCDNCSFQASHSSELINHLKLTGHQPCQLNQNQASQITHCFTCKEEFSSYWNLMNHRKQKHPSNRTCRYFLMNNCLHGVNCWYRHDEPMETQFDSGQSTKPVKDFKCNVCAKTYQNSNSLKAHVKNEHSSVLLCQNFILGKCERSDEECWFKHKSPIKPTENSRKSNISGFRLSQENQFPPDQAEIIMKTLNIVLQKMEIMEIAFQQNHQ